MNAWREGSTTTRILLVVILAGALCILALLCLLILGLLGVLPGLEETELDAGGGAVVVPTAAPGEPTVTANVNVSIRSGPGTEYAVIGFLAHGTSAEVM